MGTRRTLVATSLSLRIGYSNEPICMLCHKFDHDCAAMNALPVLHVLAVSVYHGVVGFGTLRSPWLLGSYAGMRALVCHS